MFEAFSWLDITPRIVFGVLGLLILIIIIVYYRLGRGGGKKW